MTTVTVENKVVHVVTARTGPQGVQGPPGSGATYVHDQAVPATVWTVTHNMNKYPAVVITDTNLIAIDGVLEYLSLNALQLSFNSAVAGKAVLD